MLTFKRTDDLDSALEIRDIVFIQEQNVTADLEVDGLDQDAVHYIAYKNDKAVATLRIRIVDGVAKIERVATLKDYRGQSIGRTLMQFAMDDIAKTDKISSYKLGAQTSAIPFYEKQGFKQHGDLYMDAGIEHINMIKKG